MAPKFSDFVSRLKKTTKVRIKLAVDELYEKTLRNLIYVLEKYSIKSIGKPKKTILQRHPLDFADIEASEVWIIEAEVEYPVDPYVLWEELYKVLKLPGENIVVRLETDPLEQIRYSMNALKDIQKNAKGEKASFLTTDPEYIEPSLRGDLFYGDAYNKSFREFLAKVKKARKSNVYKTGSPLFAPVEDREEVYSAYDSKFEKEVDEIVTPDKVDPAAESELEEFERLFFAKYNTPYSRKMWAQPYKDEEGNVYAEILLKDIEDKFLKGGKRK